MQCLWGTLRPLGNHGVRGGLVGAAIWLREGAGAGCHGGSRPQGRGKYTKEVA